VETADFPPQRGLWYFSVNPKSPNKIPIPFTIGVIADTDKGVISGSSRFLQNTSSAGLVPCLAYQELANVQLKDIAEYLQLRHIGSVSFITHQVRTKKRAEKGYAAQLSKLIKVL